MKLRLKQIRKARKITLDDLADMAGLSKSFLSQLETGSREPSSATLQAIASALSVTMRDLIEGGDTATVESAVAKFSRLSPDMQAQAEAYLDFLLSQQDQAKG